MTAGYVILWMFENETLPRMSEIVFPTYEDAESHLMEIEGGFRNELDASMRWNDIRRVSVL